MSTTQCTNCGKEIPDDIDKDLNGQQCPECLAEIEADLAAMRPARRTFKAPLTRAAKTRDVGDLDDTLLSDPTADAGHFGFKDAAADNGYEDQPVPVTRYRGIDKPDPTLDEVLMSIAGGEEQIRRIQDAFADLRFPGTNAQF